MGQCSLARFIPSRFRHSLYVHTKQRTGETLEKGEALGSQRQGEIPFTSPLIQQCEDRFQDEGMGFWA